MTAIPPPATPPERTGCWKSGAIGCAIVAALGAIGVVVLVVIVFGAIKSTDVYKNARDRAASDPRVIAALGSPVQAGLFVSGNVHANNGTGDAAIELPISGPNGKGRVHAVATRDSSGWHYSVLTVKPENGATIDLLNP